MVFALHSLASLLSADLLFFMYILYIIHLQHNGIYLIISSCKYLLELSKKFILDNSSATM